MRYKDLLEDELKSIKDIKPLLPRMAAAAQNCYNEWDQDEDGYDEELGEGGICQDIADAMVDIALEAGFESRIIDSGGVGDQHVWFVVQAKEGIFSVDIPPSVYETGGGYSWRKRPNIKITVDDIIIDKLSSDPNTIGDYEY